VLLQLIPSSFRGKVAERAKNDFLEPQAMSEAGNGSIDSLILERVKRAAAGLPRVKNGPPTSELDRLLAQGSLTYRVARPRGGVSLFSLVNRLLTDAHIDGFLSSTLGGMLWPAQTAFFATVMTDIVSGRLPVREPVLFLRCNEIPEIQALANAHEGLESMAVLVRFAVKISEARDWLIKHGREVPDWLAGVDSESQAKKQEIQDGDTAENDLTPLSRKTWSPSENDLPLQWLLLGMAVVGFGYKVEGKSWAVAKIVRVIGNRGARTVSKSLIKNRLNEAKDGKPIPTRSDVRHRVLLMVLAMAESHWKYSGSQDQAVFEKISSDLKGKDFVVAADRIEAILTEAGRAE